MTDDAQLEAETAQITLADSGDTVVVEKDDLEVGVNALRFAAKCASEDDNARSAIIASELADELETIL